MRHHLALLGLTACAAAIGVAYAAHAVQHSESSLVTSTNISTGMPATGTGDTDTGTDTGSATDTREWVEVTLETPGSLGVEILYKVDKLADVEHLRISGTMNSDDWTTISNISGLQSLDLSAAVCTEIPANQFNSRSSLSDITLSPAITSIGNKAFYQTSLKTIDIPAAVTNIERQAFYRCSSLTEVTFEENSRLNTLGVEAFSNCSALETIKIPDGVTSISNNCFYQCNSLKNVTLPANLQSIGQYSFANTGALQLLDFPESLNSIDQYAFQSSGITEVKLPKKLSTLMRYAFYDCRAITDLTLPARIPTLEPNIFISCSALKNITCYAAIPPTNGNEAFSGVDMSQVSLHVPEFAVVNYKLDSFWLKAGTITGDVTSDYWQIDRALALTNNRRMEGTPDIDLTTGGCLTVGGTAAMPVNKLNLQARYDYNTYQGAQIISSCPAMTAQQITLDAWFYNDYWQFISLPFDADMADITVSPAGTPYVIRYYDGAARAASGTGNSWKDVPADGTLRAGTGYIVMVDHSATLSFRPSADSKASLFEPNAKTTVLELNTSENTANAGWNLIGNPWQSYYDLYYSMLTCPVTVWNNNSSNYTAYSLIDDNVVLHPGQAFFIQADETLSEIEFGTQGRQFTAAVNRPAAAPGIKRTADNDGRSLFNITISNGAHTDATRVVLNDDASTEYESCCDASKFFSHIAEVPAIYTIDGNGEKLAINERPQTDESIRLGFIAPEAGRFTITAGRTDGTAVLHDELTGTDTSLQEGTEYTFEVDEAGENDSRFTLTLAKSSLTNITAIADGAASITSDGRTITVTGADTVEIYSIDGTRVIADRIGARPTDYTLPAGIYIVKADNTLRKCLIKNF